MGLAMAANFERDVRESRTSSTDLDNFKGSRAQKHAPPTPYHVACKKCGEPTELAADLGKSPGSPGYHVFQCYACGATDWIPHKA